ncbi:MAG: site-specific integrase [Pirellulales bacterium]|nr:site-specific integrase [Pirellulales bacterium]
MVRKYHLERLEKPNFPGQEVPPTVREAFQGQSKHQRQQKMEGSLTRERVSRIIAQIGETARVVVRQPDDATGRRIKYASAHDLRRSCAERLINAGVSAETLMVIIRHRDFATTRRFYGPKRTAQSAAVGIHQRLTAEGKKDELVGGLVGGKN